MKKPEALRLINNRQNAHLISWQANACAELRRLHEVNQELLEVLLRMMRHIPADFGGASFSDDWWKAKRIIAKATGES